MWAFYAVIKIEMEVKTSASTSKTNKEEDDDDNDDDKLFLWYGWLTKGVQPYLQPKTQNNCQRSSPSRISDTPQTGFEPVQNLSSCLVEWSCAVVMTAMPRGWNM